MNQMLLVSFGGSEPDQRSCLGLDRGVNERSLLMTLLLQDDPGRMWEWEFNLEMFSRAELRNWQGTVEGSRELKLVSSTTAA